MRCFWLLLQEDKRIVSDYEVARLGTNSAIQFASEISRSCNREGMAT